RKRLRSRTQWRSGATCAALAYSLPIRLVWTNLLPNDERRPVQSQSGEGMSAASAEGLSQCWLISAVFFVPNCAAIALWLLPLAVLLTEFCVTLLHERVQDRKSTRLNSSHRTNSYAV